MFSGEAGVSVFCNPAAPAVSLIDGEGGNLTMQIVAGVGNIKPFTANVSLEISATENLTLSAENEVIVAGLKFTGFNETGNSIATFTAANAPAAITPQKWLKVRIGSIDGWIPWFST